MKKKKNKKIKKSSLRRRIDKSQQIEYDYHLPVFLEKSVDMLITDTDGIYIDGTLGGGGHTEEILKRLAPGGTVFSFDKDKNAVKFAANRLSGEIREAGSGRLVIVNECFSDFSSIMGEHRGDVSGLLLDLGVSSYQLDTESRGISYRIEGDLDMRFGFEGATAKDLLHAAKEEELIKVLREFGEEPFSRVIARRLIERRRASTLNTTFDLRDAVIESVPKGAQYKSLSRVFQAIRIAVNNELDVLQKTLTDIIPFLKPGGRIVVISYHSLEDRIVKNTFREFGRRTQENEPKIKIITKKPLTPDENELKINPRSRSAKLRVAEKLS